MAWDGNGVFTGLHSWVQDQINGIKILADRHTDQDNVFIAGIDACLAKNGENAATGNIDLGSNKIVSLADGTANTDASNMGQLQDLDGVYFTSSGSGAAYVLAPSPAITAYAEGQRFYMKANFTTSGASTVNISGLGAKDLRKDGVTAIQSGDIVSGNVYTIIYDGTNFQLDGVGLATNIDIAGTLDVTGATTLDSTLDVAGAITGGQVDYNVQTGTTYTLTASDEGKVVTLNNASAITLTLPENSTEALPEGFNCILRQLGAGQVSVAVEGSDTLVAASSATKISGQFSEAQVDIQTAGSPNTWFMAGDIAA